VPKIDCPWIKNGEPDFIPTRVKWIETLTNKRDKKLDNVEEEKQDDQ
jgi:hypothetical protein